MLLNTGFGLSKLSAHTYRQIESIVAHMILDTITKNVPVPSIKKLNITSPITVSLPTAVLSKDVEKGEELILFVPVAKKAVEKRALATVMKPKEKEATKSQKKRRAT